MDYLRVLLVPFQPTVLILSGICGALLAFLIPGGIIGVIGTFLIQMWVFKYCYVVAEQLADGAKEPPVMSIEMLSPFEWRPWMQLAILGGGVWLCIWLGGNRAIVAGLALIALQPAIVAILGIGEPFWQALNPLALFRMVRGLGLYYLVLLAALLALSFLGALMYRLGLWSVIRYTLGVMLQVGFFALVGGSVYLRHRQIGFAPSRTPERTAAREEGERQKVRAKMIDDVFQQVRLGKHVDATQPLAAWLRNLDGDVASRDAAFVTEQALGWGSAPALNTIGSTLIRHLMRAGQPDAALGIFRRLRERSPTFTMDSAYDLRELADFAEGAGQTELAQSMRLETPVIQPHT